MPFARIADLPEQVKVLPEAAQKVWMKVVNALLKEGTAEESAFKQGWTAVKNGWEKKDDEWVRKATEKFSFFETLTGIELVDDGEKMTSKIQIMKTGDFFKPPHGRFKITEKDLDLFVENFKANTKGVEIAVDLEHEPEKGAVGWFRNIFKKGKNQLWALVEWTKEGAEMIREGKFKYISPDFNFVWADEAGKKIRNILNGAALTNRPFLKNMEPVILSEKVEQEYHLAMEAESKPFLYIDDKYIAGMDEVEVGSICVLEVVGTLMSKTIDEYDGIKKTRYSLEIRQAKGVKLNEGGEKEMKDKIKAIIETEGLSDDEIKAKIGEAIGAAPAKDGDGESVTASEFSALKATVESQKTQISTLTESNDALNNQLKEREADEKVASAIRLHKLLPKQKEWAKSYALKDPAGFDKYVEMAIEISPSLFKEEGKGTEGDGNVTLTEAEKEIQAQLGTDTEDIVAVKKEMATR